jgi:hypothetical protein
MQKRVERAYTFLHFFKKLNYFCHGSSRSCLPAFLTILGEGNKGIFNRPNQEGKRFWVWFNFLPIHLFLYTVEFLLSVFIARSTRLIVYNIKVVNKISLHSNIPVSYNMFHCLFFTSANPKQLLSQLNGVFSSLFYILIHSFYFSSRYT